ncbi:MAG: hypothetical protein DLM60_23950 [Pseudonocardiales bacterium]|nr:MAG: hypothetical protein DLM60_23950 [Pseudonocardiales bacterium]
MGSGSELSWPVWASPDFSLVAWRQSGSPMPTTPLTPGAGGAVMATLLGVTDSLGSGHRRPPRHLQLSDLDHG